MSGSEKKAASERVRESYDSLPGDSEAVIDYPQEVSGSRGWHGDVAEVEPAKLGFIPGQVGYALKPELAVDMTVTTPDGRRFSFSEGVECEDGHVPVNAEIADMIDQVYGVAVQRFADLDG